MLEITNIDLRFQRKARGMAPLFRFAVLDDGQVTAAAPDEMEVRTIHTVSYDLGGRARIRETYSVETLRKTELNADGSGIGTTEDDLYLFAEGRKTRFLEGRRVSYTDVSLAADGRRFVTAFCDLLAAGHTLALGDSKGRLVWTKDIPFAISRVAIDRAGAFVAIGGEAGELWLLDAWRNPVLRFSGESGITALATNGPGEARTVFGVRGGIGTLDANGALLWYTELPGETTEVATDAAGTVFAALILRDDTSSRLIFLSHDGIPLWDVDYDETRATGLSLSSNGRFAAVTLKDGTLSLYELHFGDAIIGADPIGTLAEAQTEAEQGDFRAAINRLRRRLDVVPSDTAACELLREMLSRFRERELAAATNAAALGDFAGADTHLAEIIQADPLNVEAVTLRRDLRRRWSQAALETGRQAQEAGDSMNAETRFLESIAADPLDVAPREALLSARRASAEAALVRGRECLTARDYPGAIRAFTEAQERGISGPEVTALLRSARAGDALTLGNELYRDRQYAAALFQFKKVLRFDPENSDARQKIAYAQTFLQDTSLSDRFSRLE